MAKKSLKPVAEKIEGSFLDIELPDFAWIKVDLTHNKTNWINAKTDAIEKVDDNFNIVINLSQKIFGEDKELSNRVKEICKLSFPPYYWREKSYRYYTSDRTGTIEDKKNILNGLLNVLKDYELSKQDQFDDSNEVFNEDAKNKVKMESSELFMKFHEPTQKFVILAKDFLGSEKFAFLRKCSEYSSQLFYPETLSNENPFAITPEFFAEELPNKKLEKKTYFIVNPSYYEEIKQHFLHEEKQQQDFVEKQKKISQENNLSQYDIETDNVFGLKVKFIPEHQCFEFYGKGYFENAGFNGQTSPRTLLGLWALNFIYSDDFNSNDIDRYSPPEMYVDKKKIDMQEVKGGTKREKNIRIPASEWPQIKKIKENFEIEMTIWGRPEKTIKITHCEFASLGLFQRYPAIYFDEKGRSFLAFSSRRNGSFKAIGDSYSPIPDIFDMPTEGGKKKRESKFSQTLKVVPISFEEVKYLLNDHPFSENIMHGTHELNARIHGPIDNQNMGYHERKEIFEKVYMHAELYSQTEKTQAPTKQKRMKL